MAKAVKVLFPGLTTNGKVYGLNEVEPNPNAYLIDVAKKKTKQYHRDSKRAIRLAEFVNLDGEEYESERVTRIPVKAKAKVKESSSKSFIDDLNDLARSEIVTISSALGLKKSFARSLEMNKLIAVTRFLRTI